MQHFVAQPDFGNQVTQARNKRMNRCMRDWRCRTLVSTQIGLTELSNRRADRIAANFLRSVGVPVSRDSML